MKKLTRIEFIAKAYKVHGNKYDYSRVEYQNSKNKIQILCKRCLNYFFQTPGNHLTGHNCTCYKIKNTDSFIDEAKKVHGGKYIYTLTIYKQYDKVVKIICANCGKIFKQRPDTHLKGHDKCCYQKHPNTLKSLEQFILDAKKVHQDNYSYHKVIYRGAGIKVHIFCKKCGKYFWQKPNSHLSGNRCTYCYIYGHKGGVTDLKVPLYETYAYQLSLYQPVYKIKNNNLELLGVECTYCKKVFVPSTKSILARLKSIKGERLGESNLYCSDGCKNFCKLYNFHPSKQIDPDSLLYINKSDKEYARSCKTDHLKQLQIDEVGYNYCEKCGTEETIIELHHTLEVAKFGQAAISSASHVLLCKACHKELTKQCRS